VLVILPLSYALTTKTPLYPNTPAPVIRPLRSMKNGDSANTSTLALSTHSGTHIDVPSHFCNNGKTVADCLTVDTTFFPTYCIDVPKTGSEEITIDDLEGSITQLQDAEALLIRTGWHLIRSDDPERYGNDHPWVSAEVSIFLREHCPRLCLFGIDQISVSSVLHREAGHECHRNFLCNKRPILIVEDLNLSNIFKNVPFRMHIYPHFIDALDGVPVTVIAEVS